MKLYAPGALILTNTTEDVIIEEYGTSFSSPIVAGLAATIMSEFTERKFNYISMLKKLLEMSLKKVIERIDKDFPNALVNKGKDFNYHLPRLIIPQAFIIVKINVVPTKSDIV